MALLVSKYNDRRHGKLAANVGWTIRLANGKLALVTWVAANRVAFMAKVLEPQPTEPEPEQEQSSS